jgi:CBS-domain-containing membrane protein
MSQADAYLEARLHRHRRVEDVMTTTVVTVDRLTPYKEIAYLLAEHRVSSLPVLAGGWQVVGVVSETGLLTAHETVARRGRAGHRGRAPRSRPMALTAGELMTAPPITIRPEAPIAAAIRAMTAHHVTSLPVTGADNQLIGIVSRRDLLSVFLRPDGDIVREVRHLLDEVRTGSAADSIVTIRHGVVILADHRVLTPATIRLIWDVDGVVDIVSRTTEGESPSQTGKSGPGRPDRVKSSVEAVIPRCSAEGEIDETRAQDGNRSRQCADDGVDGGFPVRRVRRWPVG